MSSNRQQVPLTVWDGDDHCQGEQRVEDKRHLVDQGSNFPGHVLGRADLDDDIQADRIFEVRPQLRLVNCAVDVHPDHEDTALAPKACGRSRLVGHHERLQDVGTLQ